MFLLIVCSTFTVKVSKQTLEFKKVLGYQESAW